MRFTPAKPVRRLSVLDKSLRLLGVALLVSLPACDVLNPTVVGSAGVNAVSRLNTLPGNVVIVFINQTAFPARMSVTVLEDESITNFNRLETGPASYVAAAYTCGLTSVVVTGASVSFASGTFSLVTDESDTTTLIGSTNFSCGSVITVTLEGVADNFTLTTQVF